MSDGSTTSHVLITGAAGALGRAVAQHFIDRSARLALVDHQAGRLAEVFPGLENSQHLLLSGDVTSASDMKSLAEHALKSFGRIDTLVHIAGGFEMGEATHALTRESWDRMMNLNAWSFVAVTQAVLPSMIERRAGSIIAVTAKVAARGLPAMAAYIASKSALQRLVEAMAAEAAPHGVSVNSVAPSVLDTPANRRAMPDANPADWVSTSVAAQTIGFLASPAAAALHGQHLTLDT
ncbi:SDR family NAD(P)-dependent oxidoreductase [Variovorax paradoxus]|jgi:NAD(P)-dependent dehydrogenase (short-subunit alcohol dehydrogenase family)|uniref:Dihydroanticapsin 7-dehydrogenase n=1 Tax=Variovorax paradoxus TaxID=34073 RepID=A0A679IWB3_VARPD|nr:Dihydroanticapsin 7-dehydrogenase [Variovorax paradoxus]